MLIIFFKKIKNKQKTPYNFSMRFRPIVCKQTGCNEDNFIPLHSNVFNFNPQIEEVGFFVTRVLMNTIGENEFNEFTHKQAVINKLLKNRIDTTDSSEKNKLEDEIVCLKSYLLIKAKELKEKLKFTYTGFDISKTPIPIELIAGSKNIVKNEVLNLLAKGYFLFQVYAFFQITETKFNFLSNMEKKDRSNKEELKYNKILDLLDELDKLKQLVKKFPDEGRQKKVALLGKIKKMGKEGGNIHNLLGHLISFSTNDDNLSCQRNTLR